MKNTGRVKISQCMIVKDEEKNIERALSWGKGIVSEQIVVDTGSTDRTVEIASQMGATVYHFQWINDFAAAKNYAISKANYEWIAFLDADEYFSPEDAKKLFPCIEKIQAMNYQGIITSWVHLDSEEQVIAVDTQMRIFRNLPNLRYKRRIHEYLTTMDGASWKGADVTKDLAILHTGYGEAEKKGKLGSKRNLKLIQAELEEHPDDYEMWGYLGNEYDAMEDWENAEESFRKAVSLMPEDLKEFDITASRIFVRLLNLLANKPGVEEETVMEVYRQAVERRPMDADYDYILGRYLSIQGNYQDGENHLRKALELLEKYGSTGKAMLLSAKLIRAYELLVVCCFNNGNLRDCVQFASALLKENPYLMSTLVVMISAFHCDGEHRKNFQKESLEENAKETVALFGRSFYDFNSLKDRLFVLRAASTAGWQDMIQVMRGLFTPEELTVVEKALGEDGL